MYATRSICVWELSDLDGRGECALQKLVASILAIASLVVVACKPEAAQTDEQICTSKLYPSYDVTRVDQCMAVQIVSQYVL